MYTIGSSDLVDRLPRLERMVCNYSGKWRDGGCGVVNWCRGSWLGVGKDADRDRGTIRGRGGWYWDAK